jgi:arylsulfatase A-like enzyme/Tfp pilus assembly protein PilF
VLVVTFDTTRADHLSVYGGKAQTPALERLGREGVRFDQAIAPTPITLPSHVSLFTGLYPVAHGVRNNGTFRLGDEARTLAEVLREAGFRTAAVIGSQILDSRYGLDQGFEVYDDELPPEEKVETFFVERPASAVAERALAWLRGRGEERWFLWVHFFDPHYEYQPPEPHRSRHPDSPYDGEIAYADEQSGRLVSWLEERGWLDRTLMVMAADHGESLGEHGETTHGIFIYDSTTRVPLLMRHPGRLGRGVVVPAQVRLVDVMPTVLELMEIPPAARPAMHGESLLPLLAGEAAVPRTAWIESWLPRFNYAWSELSGVRDAGWKYIRAPRAELYELAADAAESRNLAARELARADEYAALLSRTEATLRPAGGRDLARTQQVDAETRESLAALGYITLAGPGEADRGALLPDPKEKIGEYEEMARALALMRRGREAEAIPILERALRGNPRSAYLTRSLGSAYRHVGRLREGIDMMRRSLEIEPASFGTLTDLGAAYFEAGEIDRAEEIFRQVLKINPHVAVALSNLGLIEQRRGRRAAAIRLYEQALAEDPSLLRALVNLALLYEEDKRTDPAVSLYLRAIELDPENEKLFYSAGYLLFQAGRDDEALAVLDRARSAHPRSPRPALYRAQIFQKRGELDAAEREARAALALDPASAEARRHLASIEARRRKGGS